MMGGFQKFLFALTLLTVPCSLFPICSHALVHTEGDIPNVNPESETHNCLVIVLDGSGSMDGEMLIGNDQYQKKMNVAKKALLELLPKVPKNTHVGIVLFTEGNSRWLFPIAPVNLDAMKPVILEIQEDGRTPLGEAIKLGADGLLQARRQQHNYGSYQLLVVTDGEATDESLMNDVVPEVVARQIRVDVIGVKMSGGKEHTLATMAHSYQAAENANDLQLALKRAVMIEGTKGQDGVDEFALLATVPAEAARDWLKAATLGAPNHGIGEQPEPEVKPSQDGASAPQTVTSPNVSAQTQQNSDGEHEIILIIGVIAGMFLIIVIGKILFD